jgi:hypothetical protein
MTRPCFPIAVISPYSFRVIGKNPVVKLDPSEAASSFVHFVERFPQSLVDRLNLCPVLLLLDNGLPLLVILYALPDAIDYFSCSFKQ